MVFSSWSQGAGIFWVFFCFLFLFLFPFVFFGHIAKFWKKKETRTSKKKKKKKNCWKAFRFFFYQVLYWLIDLYFFILGLFFFFKLKLSCFEEGRDTMLPSAFQFSEVQGGCCLNSIALLAKEHRDQISENATKTIRKTTSKCTVTRDLGLPLGTQSILGLLIFNSLFSHKINNLFRYFFNTGWLDTLEEP